MAWAERLSSGRYRGRYRDARGHARSVPKRTFDHKARAERAAAVLEDKARRSLWADPDAARRTWGEWCEQWWPTREVEPSTLYNDANRRDNHLMPTWDAIPLGAIRRHDVKAWAAQLRAGGLGPSTVQRCVHLFSASLSAAMDAEILEANPASRIKLPGTGEAQERFLDIDEYEAIVHQLPTGRDQLIAHVLVYTGLRWGEMAGLHRHRVDLERGMLRVVEVLDTKSWTIKAYPKGRRTRDVPIPRWLCDELAKLSTRTVCDLEHVGTRASCRSGLLLTSKHGTALSNTNWYARVWKPAVERAQVQYNGEATPVGEVRIHDLRHTYASWLLQEGVTLAEVGQLLGHISPATTQRYAFLEREPSKAVLAALPRPRHREPISSD